MSKAIYAEDDDLQLWVEVVNDCLFVHVHLHKFSPPVLNKLKVAWEHLQTASYFDGWEQIFTYTKDPRIVSLIGGAEEVVSKDLPTGWRMFQWELK